MNWDNLGKFEFAIKWYDSWATQYANFGNFENSALQSKNDFEALRNKIRTSKSFFPEALRWCLLSKTEFSYITIGIYQFKDPCSSSCNCYHTKSTVIIIKITFVKCHLLLLTGFGFSSRGTADGSTLSLLWNILKDFRKINVNCMTLSHATFLCHRKPSVSCSLALTLSRLFV